jgi:hypothetical protein
LLFTFNRAELFCGGWACSKLAGGFSRPDFSVFDAAWFSGKPLAKLD